MPELAARIGRPRLENQLGRPCSKCDTILTEVNTSKSGKRGSRAQCKACWNTYMRGYMNRNPHKRQAPKTSAKRHQYKLRSMYGLSVDDYDAMMDEQNHVCVICNEPEKAVDKRTGEPRRLAVDHDHETDAIRGLLCTGCNTALGAANDDPQILRAMAEYLERNN